MQDTLRSDAPRRQRRVLSCVQCRKKKLRCNRGQPCSNCQRSRTKICTYQHPPPTPPLYVAPDVTHSAELHPNARPDGESIADASAERSPQVVHPEGHPPASVWLSSPLGSLLVCPTPTTSWSGEAAVAESPNDRLGDVRVAPTERCLGASSLAELSAPVRAIMVKSRYLTSSHWLYSVTLNLHTLKWLDQEVSTKGECWQALRHCKTLGERARAQCLLPPSSGHYGSYLPEKSVLNKLLESYLCSFETVHRIVHVPSFKQENETLLENMSPSNEPLLIRLQLCLAIGACIYDDVFSFRPHALQWIMEAEQWLASKGHARITVVGIQIMCLLYLARQATESIYGDQLSILAATLLRSAICIGLHRDPHKLPSVSMFQTEMHKRLWATILELVLDSSTDSGQPPLLSSEDFDCDVPANIDDSQLHLDRSIGLVPQNPDQYTDTSVQIALRRSFESRLAIAKHSTRIQQEFAHKDVLALDSQLVEARQLLTKTLNSFKHQLSAFQKQYCDAITLRYVFTLHLPYLPLPDPTHYYSRKSCVDAALRLSYYTLPLYSTDAILQTQFRVTAAGIDHYASGYTRLLLCGSGSLRATQHIAISVIAADLASIVLDDEMSRGGSKLRIAEQLSLLHAGVEWSKQRIRAGQKNVKDYVYFAALHAGIKATIGGECPDHAMNEQGKAALDHAVEILSELTGGQPRVWDDMPAADGYDLDVLGRFWTGDLLDLTWTTL